MIVCPRKSSDSFLKCCFTLDLISSSSSHTLTFILSVELWHSLEKQKIKHKMWVIYKLYYSALLSNSLNSISIHLLNCTKCQKAQTTCNIQGIKGHPRLPGTKLQLLYVWKLLHKKGTPWFNYIYIDTVFRNVNNSSLKFLIWNSWCYYLTNLLGKIQLGQVYLFRNAM